MEERILAVVAAKAKMYRSQEKPASERCHDRNGRKLAKEPLETFFFDMFIDNHIK